MENELIVKCPSFENGGAMPKRHTGFGEDVSPAFELENLPADAASLAIILDDLDVPFASPYNHWLIWNIPASPHIPEAIPHGASVPALGAVQGVAYGRNRYRGPKQPFFIRKMHRYVFTVYALDCLLTLDGSASKKDVLAAMQGHILRQGSITGTYKR